MKRTEQLQEALERIGKMVKTLREQRKLTQLELAVKMEVAQAHVSKLESGESNPTVETLIKAGNALGYALDINYARMGEAFEGNQEK